MADKKTFNWWTGFRVFCLVGGIGLGSAAYVAPEWVGQFMSIDLASTVALVLLLMLPATMIFQLGGGRLRRAIRKSGQRARARRAREDLPAWAERHGLTFRPADEPDAVGTAMGTFDGYKVLVDPDAGDLSARWKTDFGEAQLDLSTTPEPGRAPAGLSAFDTGDDAFDEAFPTRFATDEIASRLEGADDARQSFVEFWLAHRGQLENLGVDEHGVVCFLDDETRYDVDTISNLVAALVELLQTVEPSLERLGDAGDGP